jgi:mitogen-activated protein kinase kinase kinase
MGARQALLHLQKRLMTPQKWAKCQRLGKGGFGTVFMGLNTETGDVFAVKQQEL